MVEPVISSPRPAPGPGSLLADRYELVRFIARGGMADVYEAQDRVLGRRVAVKLFRAAEAVDRQRFDAEVVLLAGLSHPNLVSVYDAGDHEGDGFVVLELVEGPSLDQVLGQRGALPPTEVRDLGRALASALDHVHERGIVHRDLTPANVLCGPDGSPRLTDFGIARLLDTTRVTAVSTTIGTAAYMAPEQVQGQDVTPAADVYALGLVLLEALTGAPAFSGAPHEAAVARLARDPEVPDDLPAPWPRQLRAMTAREPGDRPTAAQVADHLGEGASEARPAASAARIGAAAAVAGAAVAAAAPRPSGPVVVPAADGSTSVPAGATTTLPAAGASPSAPASGSTAVMPAVMAPRPPATTSGSPAAAAARARPGWHWAVAALVLLLAVLAVRDLGDGRWLDPALDARRQAELQQVAEQDPVATTTTTAAPATTLPPPPPNEDEKGEGEEEGRGKGKKDDD